MTDTLTYNGYDALVEFDASQRTLHGRVIGIRDVIGFQGTSIDELESAMHEAIDDYLEQCARDGEKPAKPYSGEFRLRVGSELHRRIAVAARRRGISINTWLTEAARAAVESAP